MLAFSNSALYVLSKVSQMLLRLFVHSRLVDLLEDVLETTVVFLQDGAASTVSPATNAIVAAAKILLLLPYLAIPPSPPIHVLSARPGSLALCYRNNMLALADLLLRGQEQWHILG